MQSRRRLVATSDSCVGNEGGGGAYLPVIDVERYFKGRDQIYTKEMIILTV